MINVLVYMTLIPASVVVLTLLDMLLGTGENKEESINWHVNPYFSAD